MVVFKSELGFKRIEMGNRTEYKYRTRYKYRTSYKHRTRYKYRTSYKHRTSIRQTQTQSYFFFLLLTSGNAFKHTMDGSEGLRTRVYYPLKTDGMEMK